MNPQPGSEPFKSGYVSAEPVALAEPWRRFLASTADAVIIFIAIFLVQVMWMAMKAWLDIDSGDRIVQAILSACAILYVWLGWGLFGATLGKRLLGICIVREDGGRLTLWDAAVRYIGYVIACMPLRLGLAWMLLDEKRRGWHDILARTIVVHAHRATTCMTKKDNVPLPVSLQPEEVRVGWSWVGAGVLYASIALISTFPLILHISTHRLGTAGDGSHFMWCYWWFDHAMSSGKPVMRTGMLFHPQEVSLLSTTVNWVHCILAIPLLRLLNLTATYNVLLLGSIIGCAVAMYVLVVRIVGDRVVALVMGLAFGFSPYFVAHSDGHANLVSAFCLPLFALVWWRLLSRPRAREGLIPGMLLAIAAYCDWYYLFCGLLLAGALLLGTRLVGVSNGHSLKGQVTAIAVAAGTCIFLLSPLLIPFLSQRASFSYMEVPYSVVRSFQADLLDWLRPSPFQPVLAKLGDKIISHRWHSEWTIMPGFGVLGLAVVGIWKERNRAAPWALAATLGVVMALGMDLQIGGSTPLALPALLIGGVPGNGLGLALSSYLSCHLALICTFEPSQIFGEHVSAPLPLAWFREFVPGLKALKVPARFGLITLLSLGVCAGWGLRYLRARASMRWSVSISTVLTAGLAVLILFECLHTPSRLYSTRVNPFYHQLAQEDGDFAIVEVPFTEFVREYQMYQTVHRKKLFAGTLSRTPPSAFSFIQGNDLLLSLGPKRVQFNFESNPADLLAAERMSLLKRNPEAIVQSLVALKKYNARYIVVHKNWLTSKGLSDVDILLGGMLGLGAQDFPDSRDPLRVYDVGRSD